MYLKLRLVLVLAFVADPSFVGAQEPAWRAHFLVKPFSLGAHTTEGVTVRIGGDRE
jgi:hypothetical protein